jgi:hypothetical protein
MGLATSVNRHLPTASQSHVKCKAKAVKEIANAFIILYCADTYEYPCSSKPQETFAYHTCHALRLQLSSSRAVLPMMTERAIA